MERTIGLKPVTEIQLKDLVRTSNQSKFTNNIDMDRIKAAVKAGEPTVSCTKNRTFSLEYYYRGERFKVYISPKYGYAPCGHFDVADLLRGE